MRAPRILKRWKWLVVGFVAVAGGAIVALIGSTGWFSAFGARPEGARLERMKASPRFGGKEFRNTEAVAPGMKDDADTWSITRDFLLGGRKRTPRGVLPVENPRPVWDRAPASGLRVTWLGHSTLLVEIEGFRVLTDPVWGERASPSSLVGPKRFHPPPASLDALPPIDVVVISHDHYDHLDTPTIRELARLEVPFVVPLGVGAHLEAWGVAARRITELDWWEEWTLREGELTLTATPAQHFSGRGLGDRNGTLWASWVIATSGRRVYFSGDTGLTREFEDIRTRKGPFDLVMLEVGAWHPAWGDIHLGPENALVAHQMLGGGPLLPIHWGTFDLGLHPWEEPAETLAGLAAQRGVDLLTPRLGMPIEPSAVRSVEAWWRGVDQQFARAMSVAEPAVR